MQVGGAEQAGNTGHIKKKEGQLATLSANCLCFYFVTVFIVLYYVFYLRFLTKFFMWKRQHRGNQKCEWVKGREEKKKQILGGSANETAEDGVCLRGVGCRHPFTFALRWHDIILTAWLQPAELAALETELENTRHFCLLYFNFVCVFFCFKIQFYKMIGWQPECCKTPKADVKVSYFRLHRPVTCNRRKSVVLEREMFSQLIVEVQESETVFTGWCNWTVEREPMVCHHLGGKCCQPSTWIFLCSIFSQALCLLPNWKK